MRPGIRWAVALGAILVALNVGIFALGRRSVPGMVLVPGGPVQYEAPDKTMTAFPSTRVAPFYIDVYPVTNAQYRRFVEATNHRAPSVWPGGHPPAGEGMDPVAYISWFDARDYARWAGKRLPTDAEWCHAAEQDAAAHSVRDVTLDGLPLRPVGTRADDVSRFGVRDCYSAVFQWTASVFPPLPTEPHTLPFRTVRGPGLMPTYPNNVVIKFGCGIGFRCALDGDAGLRARFGLRDNGVPTPTSSR